MRVFIIGIDGLETSILDEYIDILPNFKRIREKGILDKINSVFPADSVPAWLTIYTGLNPAMHGIIRGKDYVESVEDFNKRNNFKLEGASFWDKLGEKKQKCLILNPYLAYPSWPVNGVMISGPSFIEGEISKHPETTICDDSVYGGYKAIGRVSELQESMSIALNDIEKLWKEFYSLFDKDNYNLSFVLFTTLDRIQHYTWRFYDKNDPLFHEDPILSCFIPDALKLLDKRIGELMDKMNADDHLVIISDHGFGPRPYKLINFNELLRQNGLLKIKEGQASVDVQFKQKLRNVTVKILSKLKILDTVAVVLRKTKYFSKYKKSDFLIDKVNSECYIDENFCGKKPYCGFNFGEKIKNGTKEEQKIVLEKLREIILSAPEVPNPKWMKFNYELYQGEYYDRYPDVCMEMPKEYGVEFELFGRIVTESATHFKISGGHYDAGTFGYYSTGGGKKKIGKLEEFHNLIVSLFE
jgi:predicted AlkP superfamily phosphohydrolase/phosphomutase